jgi:hypothetical protein
MRVLYEAEGVGYGHAFRACLYARSRPADQFDLVVSSVAADVIAPPPNVRLVRGARRPAEYDEVILDTWARPRSGWVGDASSVSWMRRLGAPPSSPDCPPISLVIQPGEFDGEPECQAQCAPPILWRPDCVMAKLLAGDSHGGVVFLRSGGGDCRARETQLIRLLSRFCRVAESSGPDGWRIAAGARVAVGGAGWTTVYACLAAGTPLVAVPFASPEQSARLERAALSPRPGWRVVAAEGFDSALRAVIRLL